MKIRIAWILVTAGAVLAVLAVVFLAGGGDRPPQPPPPPAAPGRPSGDAVNRATGAAVQMLSQCLSGRPLPQCREKPMISFVFSVSDQAGRVQGLTLKRGWLDPDLLECWRGKVKDILVEAPEQAGMVNVQYPLACDQQGKIHIRPPVWGGSMPEKNIPPP